MIMVNRKFDAADKFQAKKPIEAAGYEAAAG
jgi:hypothetical protein